MLQHLESRKLVPYLFLLLAALLAFNIIFKIFDQVGLIDILFMLLNLAELIMVYLYRKEFLPV